MCLNCMERVLVFLRSVGTLARGPVRWRLTSCGPPRPFCPLVGIVSTCLCLPTGEKTLKHARGRFGRFNLDYQILHRIQASKDGGTRIFGAREQWLPVQIFMSILYIMSIQDAVPPVCLHPGVPIRINSTSF